MPSVALSRSAAQKLIGQYKGTIDSNLNGGYDIDLIIQRLEAKVQNLESIALSAYSALGFSGGNIAAIEAQLKQKIAILQQETAALNGVNLQNCFLEALKTASAFNINFEQELQDLQNYMAQQTGDEIRSGPTATLLLNEILSAIDNSIPKHIVVNIGTSGRAYDTKTGAPVFDFTKGYTQLSKVARRKFDSYITKKRKEGTLNSGTLKTENVDTIKLTQEYIVENISTESLLKMKAEDRERLFKQYPRLKDNINRNFIRQIINACPVSNKTILTSCVQEVLSKKPLAFFVGGNIEGMTGILGEIQALYYFRSLTNGKGSSVSWIGGIGNPHSDLLLTKGLEQFGIQVKNTSRSAAELEVSFQTFGAKRGREIGNTGAIYKYLNTDEALTSFASLNIPGGLQEAIQTFLAMEGFNIYYKWNPSSHNAQAVGLNKDFQAEREAIEEYAEYGRKIASLLSVSMMYMQETNFSSGGSNTLYLIGGSTLISAATILVDIISKLKANLTSFKLKVEGHSAAKGKKSAKTIVDVINSKGHLGDTAFKLESSYTFGL